MDIKTIEKMAEISRIAASTLTSEKLATFETFVEAFYGRSCPDDLLERDADELFSIAHSMWKSGYKRSADTPTLKILNPRSQTGGWYCRKTAVNSTQAPVGAGPDVNPDRAGSAWYLYQIAVERCAENLQ